MKEKDTELSYWEKQLIKYTKGHYGRIQYENDIMHFPSNAYGISLEQIEKYHILGMVVRLHEKLVKLGYLTFRMERFIDDIFRRSRMERNDYDNTTREDIIKQMLSEFQNMQVKFDDGEFRDLELGEVEQDLYKFIQKDIAVIS